MLTLIEHARNLDVYEVALNFADAVHGGDRRKKSQQCSFDDKFDFKILDLTFMTFSRAARLIR